MITFNVELRKIVEGAVGFVNRAEGQDRRLFGILVKDDDFTLPGFDLHNFSTAIKALPALLDEVERYREAYDRACCDSALVLGMCPGEPPKGLSQAIGMIKGPDDLRQKQAIYATFARNFDRARAVLQPDLMGEKDE